MVKRRKTKVVKIGAVKIGGKSPISIQSMCKTDTSDVRATVKQVQALEQAGCEIIRVAVKDMGAALALAKIRTKIDTPLVADIHFNYRLALEAVSAGVDGLRLNPGNIYRPEEVKEVAQVAKKRKISIRVGVNSGSLRCSLPIHRQQADGMPNKLGNYNGRSLPIHRQQADGMPNKLGNYNGRSLPIHRQKKERLADLMVQSALDYIEMLEGFGFYDIIVSLKASDATTTVAAYRKIAKMCRYPLHLGITASGLPESGIIKSAIAIGSLLLDGIGDTIRVSLTASPEQEVIAARNILQSLGRRNFCPEVIACPTCGRCQVNLEAIVRDIDKRIHHSPFTIYHSRARKIAVMGCEVNGPGEAADADLGIACGKNSAALFKKGKIVKKIKEDQIVDTLIQELINR